MATTTVPVMTRVKPNEKDVFAQTCDMIGTTPSNALRMFIVAFNKRGGFPFNTANPLGFNEETLAAMDDAVNGRNLSGPFKTNEEMWGSIFDEGE